MKLPGKERLIVSLWASWRGNARHAASRARGPFVGEDYLANNRNALAPTAAVLTAHAIRAHFPIR